MLTNKLMGAAGGADEVYIEDVFSTYLYTGNGSTQTITNGIDLSTKGGMVWAKARSSAFGNAVFDTVRGSSSGNARRLITNSTVAATTTNEDWLSFNSNGFTANADPGGGIITANGTTYASWTFRKAPKFFDVVTYTGTGGSTTNNVAHSLGVTPGMVIIKKTSNTSNWYAAARDGTSSGKYTYSAFSYNAGLNLTAAASISGVGYENLGWITSTQFQPNNLSATGDGGVNDFNASGQTYVAYLFAHDAGGFGASGTDNVISCGSYTGNGATVGPVVTLGYEPQWILVKDVTATDGYGNWLMFDNMRGWPVGSNGQQLFTNSSTSEGSADRFVPTATGFNVTNGYAQSNVNGNTYIYMAIRRGPMKTPTSGASVFSPITSSAAQGTAQTTDFPVDMQGQFWRAYGGYGYYILDRLRGVSSTSTESGRVINTSSTAAESESSQSKLWNNTGFSIPGTWAGGLTVYHSFRRAPGFFDVVCYTGTGAVKTVNHNLGVAPEMMVIKSRASATQWGVYHAALGATKASYLNGTGTPVTASSFFNDTSPTSSLFTVNFSTATGDATNYVAYLFATCPGVSKVGSYTGTGTTKQIDCGFTTGARFVLIKRTDSTGDWYTWDSARGIVSGNDPYLLMNSTAAENTSTDYIDPYAAGFEISSTAPAAINASGGTFIFLAIA